MKAVLISAFLAGALACSWGATTINALNHQAFGANIGWGDCRGDAANGAIVGEYVCSGYIYAANVGWINLGSGSPTNGSYYRNLSADDFGVNQDGLGNLSGLAYGANIGWVSFEATGAPKVDLATGNFSGWAYSANCGWISLGSALAYVQTDSIAPGADTDGNGLADAWERLYWGHIGVAPGGDEDGDGASNLAEYLAGTSPFDPADVLRITAYDYMFGPGMNIVMLTWNSVPRRFYRIYAETDLSPDFWSESMLGLVTPDGSSTTRMFQDPAHPTRFFRVRAVRPLAP
jgi:hypothetical protein